MGRTDAEEEQKDVDSALLLMTNPVRAQFAHTGLADDEIVALMGRRTLGFFYPEDEYQGKWVQNPYVFDNTYFQELLNDKTRYIKFDDDRSMLTDPSFRKYVEIFAEDQDLFFETFAKAFVKVSEFGQEDKLLSEI